MQTRNITVTLEKAKEWYNSDNTTLKELALQAFREKELIGFKGITTFEEAVNALGLIMQPTMTTMKEISKVSKASAASFRLNIIRKALHIGKDLNFTKGYIYYPYNPCITTKSTYYNSELRSGDMKKVATVCIEGEKYFLFGGGTSYSSFVGLGSFVSNFGVTVSGADVGFLGCSCKEIAQHMSKYFARDIFEAKYGDTIDYKWV